MDTSATSISAARAGRVAWVDAAKGLCIIMVVMGHAVIGVETAAGQPGWMGYVVSFARPFRMPDFFLISGLFLGLVIDRPWLRYIDRKVVHFAYFYVMWLTIQFAFRAPFMAMEEGVPATLGAYLLAFVEPFGTLWFIYILPVFFVFTRLVKALPAWLLLAGAAGLEIWHIHTGWTVVDEFASRYLWFLIGYVFAARIFDIAAWARENPGWALALIALWAPLNAWLVFTPPPPSLAWLIQPELSNAGARGGIAEMSFVSLPLALAGITVVIWVAALLSERRSFAWLTWLGAHSLVVYLAFFLPMVMARLALLHSGIITDVGTISLLTLIAAVAGPVLLYFLVKWSGRGGFLFERPRWAYLDRAPAGRRVAVPAE